MSEEVAFVFECTECGYTEVNPPAALSEHYCDMPDHLSSQQAYEYIQEHEGADVEVRKVPITEAPIEVVDDEFSQSWTEYEDKHVEDSE